MVDLTKEEAAALLCWIELEYDVAEKKMRCRDCPHGEDYKECSGEYDKRVVDKVLSYIGEKLGKIIHESRQISITVEGEAK